MKKIWLVIALSVFSKSGSTNNNESINKKRPDYGKLYIKGVEKGVLIGIKGVVDTIDQIMSYQPKEPMKSSHLNECMNKPNNKNYQCKKNYIKKIN
jgi:hypothetical protein